jgi:hypothetical protein
MSTEKAAHSLVEELMALGLECFRVPFPKGIDATACALKMTPADKTLALVLNGRSGSGNKKAPKRETIAILTEPAIEAPPPGVENKEEAAKEKIPETVSGRADAVGPRSDPRCSLSLSASVDVSAEVWGEEIVITLVDRRYRVHGLGKNLSYNLLKVNVLAFRGEGFHVDTLITRVVCMERRDTGTPPSTMRERTRWSSDKVMGRASCLKEICLRASTWTGSKMRPAKWRAT